MCRKKKDMDSRRSSRSKCFNVPSSLYDVLSLMMIMLNKKVLCSYEKPRKAMSRSKRDFLAESAIQD